MATTKRIPLLVGVALSALFVASSFFLFKEGFFPEIGKFFGPKIDLVAVEKTENIVPFLVLGSGPASLSAALYGARSKIRTVVLRGNQPGGQLTGTSYVENWPGIRKIRGIEVVRDLEEQAHSFGAMMVNDSARSVDLSRWPYEVTTEEGNTLYALSLFVGTGSTPRKLGVPGEHEYWGKGVTTCAICDAPYHKGDDVVVIGGGDSAVEEALELSAYAKEVRMLVRTDSMRASPSMVERLDDCNNITVMFNTSLLKINGNGDHVTSVEVINNVTKESEVWPDIKGVFLAIGHTPNTSIFKNGLATAKGGYLKMEGRRQSTSVTGVFAAGDVSDPRYKQAGVAAGDGIKGGLDAVWWLSEQGYNQHVQERLEPYFFDPLLDKKVELKQVNSLPEYLNLVREAKGRTIILDFYTPYCPSCMHMMPVVQTVATQLQEKILVAKVNAAIAFDLVKKFQPPQAPHFIVLKESGQGEDPDGDTMGIVARSNEVMDRAQFYAFAKKYSK